MIMDFNIVEVVEANYGSISSSLSKSGLISTDNKVQQVKGTDEIGDGNLNTVYRITFTDECSVIAKYAPPYIKCLGPAYPLTQARLDVEYSGLSTCDRLYPGCVPVPLQFGSTRNTVFMEDLKGWVILRNELINGRVNTSAVEALMVSIANVHNLSTEPACTTEEHKKLCQVFDNKDMVGVTEQYVFMKPFAVNDPTNKHDPLLNDEVARLRSDKKCLDRAEEMRKLFVECHDSFCHGDLHTGSVMVKDGQCKMFDIEFALMGPASFDFGTFLANLLFTLIRHNVLNNGNVVTTIKDTIMIAIRKYFTVISAGETSQFIHDTCGFIGCELIRRVIGAAHVEDLSSLPEGELKALILGRQFLSVSCSKSDSLWDTVNGLLKTNGY